MAWNRPRSGLGQSLSSIEVTPAELMGEQEVEKSQLVELTADIVSAHVANNAVQIGEVPTLVQQVHEALSSLGNKNEEPSPQRRPAVSLRASVKPDYLICLRCGKKLKALKRHIKAAHDLSPADYREQFGLKAGYPMVSSDYAEIRRTLAKKAGLGGRRTSRGKAAGKSRRGRADPAK